MDKNQSVVSVTEESMNTIENHLVTGPLILTSEDEHNQDQPASQEMRCIICDEVGTESLKQLKSSTTLRIAAQHRMNLKKDMFKAATGRVRNLGEHGESIYRYHSSCNRRFCAVKRPVDKNNEDSESTPSNKTRSSVTLPTTNTRGVTQNQCILCTDNRKRVKGKSGGFERLCRVETKSSSDEITAAAQRSPHLPQSQRVLSLRSDDLIAQEAKYHNSCKRKLIRVSRDVTSTEMEYGEATARKIHDTVTPNFLQYVESEVIVKRKPLMVNKLMDLYKEEYVAAGGNREDLTSYSMQALIKKINNQHRKNVLISKDSNKSGNFIYPVGMEVEDPKALLKESNPLIETVKCAAMTVRSEILQLPKSRTPYPTTIHTLKMASPNIPPLTDLFFSTLLNGISPITQSKTQRKSTSLASDAVFSTTRGHVRPWKNTALGLGLSSMLGSKTAISILNRNGHTISYDQCKRLETEIAYSCTSESYETPAGLQRKPMQSTGLAWDNFDLNLETLDGKGSLHVTVGIAYQNLLDVDEQNVTYDFSSEQPRRRYDGPVKLIPPFHKNLKTAKFNFGPQETVITNQKVIYDIHKARDIDMLWLIISMYTKVPMFNGFFSKFVNDSLPITAIGYLDPISQSPTRNDVVRETMIRSQIVAHETEASYMPVTYDLAVALKAYSIQALEKPLFDNLVILLGNFHVELAFYGAMGTYIADSGIEYILTEAGVLAEGSLPGFLKGKHYNRCTRIHQLAASVLERLLFERFLLVSRRAGDNTEHEDDNQYQQIIDEIKNLSIEDMDAQKKEVSKDDFKRLLSEFEAFLAKVMKGHLGKTAAYWGTYIYLINRLHREMKRAIRMNDVELYKKIVPQMIEVFFSLNRPNYARRGVLFQRKLETLDSAALDVLKAGAFSTRRTSKSYSRAAVDLTLEQSINCDAASSATGITHFGNSEKAFRRWCVNLSQRSMAVNAMKDLSGLQAGETPDNQLKNHRIIRDNKDMKALQETISDICNPFADTAPTDLVNIVTGKVANNVTKNYLTGCLQRGADLKNKFTQECKADESRLLKTVKRVKVENFAAENVRKKSNKSKTAVESARDGFGNILACIGSAENSCINLQEIMTYPITEVPLSLAHTDGSPTKTEKAALTKLLEVKQEAILSKVPSDFGTVMFDGGLVLHEILPHHTQSTYGAIVRDIMVKVCSVKQSSVHLLLDKYIDPSIKDGERRKRGADNHNQEKFIINSPDQKQRLKGNDLLKNGPFKEEFACFVMSEVRKEYYAPIVVEKTVYVSHGGKCLKLMVNSIGMLIVTEPPELQGQHEEADTLIAFHVKCISEKVLIRCSDTDVLVILVGLVPQINDDVDIIMDFGTANSRRLIHVTSISRELEKTLSCLSEALTSFHALTGCDFTSAFYRKGKSGPLSKLEKSPEDVKAMQSLCTDLPDMEGVTRFICKIYGYKNQTDINEARFSSFLKMTGGKKMSDKVKKINCASLPPCEKSLLKHLQRVNYVSILWRQAHMSEPAKNIHPLNYGWKETEGKYLPDWFDGDALPTSFSEPSDDETCILETDDGIEFDDLDEEKDDKVWSGDSESDCDSD